ncbi:MAG: class I SAM-dependent methyltransferase [Candidatus Pacebacteria bacterium]|nr:class I SAM-dependent methyltransferase [Candidatus Paceibacterota bacterium]
MFNFGKNWLNYSKTISNKDLEVMKESLVNLIGLENIKDKTFLDIGCGSGLFAIAAKKLGAGKVIGIDILADSVKSSEENKIRFNIQDIEFKQLSILDNQIKDLGKFDIVYAWGSLHHTGEMWKTIENTIHCVENNGLLILAIYNKHWTSPVWGKIKYFYNISSKFIKKIMVFIFYYIIATAKLLVTRKNPFQKKRGMNFYYDIVDWLGGYPYEYANKDEIVGFANKYNFRLIKFSKASVPTGCNEFVFKKSSHD